MALQGYRSPSNKWYAKRVDELIDIEFAKDVKPINGPVTADNVRAALRQLGGIEEGAAVNLYGPPNKNKIKKIFRQKYG